MSTHDDEKLRNDCVSFLCCGCFSKSKFKGDSEIYLSDKNEPYEYVVEKLAIKKVPVSLFTLSDRLPKKPSQSSGDSSSTPSVQTTPLALNHTPSVSFTSYYKLQPLDRIDDKNSQSSKDRKSISFDEMVREKEIRNTVLPTLSPRKILTEKQSRDMVAGVLKKHSSLFTLDSKDPVPKDPNHLPNNRTVVPPSVKHAIKKQQKTYINRLSANEREVSADVHNIPFRKPALKGAYSPNRQDIAQSIQTTIDSLKYTQKPHLPGIPPKNQKSLKTSITDSASEKEYFCVAPILGITDSNYFNKNVATNSKMFTNQNVKDACDYEIYYNKLQRESNDRDKYFPFHAEAKRNSVVQRSTHWYPQERKYVEYDNKKRVYTVPAEDEFHGPYHLRKSEYYNPKYIEMTDEDENDKTNKSNGKEKENENDRDKDKNKDNDKDKNNINKNGDRNPSRDDMEDDRQIADVRPKQGQSLKWKIIVKHHKDKKSDGEASGTGTGEDTSESFGTTRRR